MRRPTSRSARVRIERRIRRGLRAGIVTAAVATVTAGIGLTALPAGAAVTPPSLRLVGGNQQVTAAWTSVAGATGYTVELSRSSSLAGATIAHTTILHKAFTGLANGTTYYVRVIPEGIANATSAQSTVRSIRATSAMPIAVSQPTLTTQGTDKLKVSWTGGGNATKIAIIAGSSSMTDVNHFSTGWYAATTRSVTITVPSTLRRVLGGGSGNYIFVKVAESNSTASNPTKYLHYDSASKYVLTQSSNAPRSWGLAGNPATSSPAVSRISVASWNVQGITASATYSWTNQWAQRLTRVAANIELTKPDLIGAQELGTARMKSDCLNHGAFATDPTAAHCQEQYESLAAKLAASTATTKYRLAAPGTMPPWYWIYHQPSGAYVDSMLFYNPAKLAMEAAGYISPRTTLKVTGWPSSSDQAGMWARFRVLATGQRFVAASIHLPVQSGSTWNAIRQDEAAKLADYLDGSGRALYNSTRLPIVLVGDLNANGATDAHAGSLVLRGKGYFDTGSTPNRTGQRYSSSNGSNGTDYVDPGYPKTATIHKYATSRIDYILTKGSPYTYSYANLLRLVSGTSTFDTRYNGSDHNLQLAQIGITAAVPVSLTTPTY